MADRGRSRPCKKNPGQMGSPPRAWPGGILVDGEARTQGSYGDGAVGVGDGELRAAYLRSLGECMGDRREFWDVALGLLG